MDITGAQCRAARALANLTQDQLAGASRVSKRTITHFESEERQPIPSTLTAIRTALELAGIEFISENGGGAGVRLKKPSSRFVYEDASGLSISESDDPDAEEFDLS